MISPMPSHTSSQPLSLPGDASGPIMKRVIVAADAARAYDAYVLEMGQWWPLAERSVSMSAKAKLSADPHVFGQLTETAPSGERHVWGTVIASAPQLIYSHTWHPGGADIAATTIHVMFMPIKKRHEQSTRSLQPSELATAVLLIHSGWEMRGKEGRAMRSQHDAGWNGVLAAYLKHLEAHPA
jgi:hypothetical protein